MIVNLHKEKQRPMTREWFKPPLSLVVVLLEYGIDQTLPKCYHLDVVGGPSTPHDPESDAGGSLSSWQATQAGKVKDEGRS
jgi:hypothetical protein